jgi:hypothetical protein
MVKIFVTSTFILSLFTEFILHIIYNKAIKYNKMRSKSKHPPQNIGYTTFDSIVIFRDNAPPPSGNTGT